MNFRTLLFLMLTTLVYSKLSAQENDNDHLLTTSLDFFEKLVGDWEFVNMEVIYSTEEEKFELVGGSFSLEKMENGIGINGRHENIIKVNNKEVKQEGFFRYMYSKSEKKLLYSYWRKQGMASQMDVKFTGKRWITEYKNGDGKMMDIIFFDDDGNYIVESSVYNENTELVAALMIKYKKKD